MGSCLPTESELIKRYKVSRFTVREALKLLPSQGLVRIRHGIGTEVIARTPVDNTFTFSSDSLTDFRALAKQTRMINVQTRTVSSDQLKAVKTPFKRDQTLIEIRAERIAHKKRNKPIIATMTAYITDIYADSCNVLGKETASIYQLIEQRYGVVTSEIRQVSEPVMLRDDQCKRFKTKKGSLGLRTTREYYDQHGALYDYTISYHASDYARIAICLHRQTL